jgi:Transcriptional repressor NrdR-like, N-terminal domain
MEDAPRRSGGPRTRFDAPGGCPACDATMAQVRVIETRRRVDGSLRRRRRCLVCGHRWTTTEGAAERAERCALAARRRVREVEVRVPVPIPVPVAAPEAGEGAAPWAIVESAASVGSPVFVEYDPARRVWLCALTDELNPAEGDTAGAAIRSAEVDLRRLLGDAD